MADKKITELAEKVTSIVGTDILPIVSNNAYPTNYKVQVKHFLSGLTVELPITTQAGLSIAASVVANSTAVQSAAEFRLNSGNTSIGGTQSYGAIINHTVANTDSGASKSPVAFLGLMDIPGTSGNATTYLMDIGLAGTANVSANLTHPNSSVMVCRANTTTVAAANSMPATHMLKFRINGTDYWLLASNTAPA
jgi:hypothetical protein